MADDNTKKKWFQMVPEPPPTMAGLGGGDSFLPQPQQQSPQPVQPQLAQSLSYPGPQQPPAAQPFMMPSNPGNTVSGAQQAQDVPPPSGLDMSLLNGMAKPQVSGPAPLQMSNQVSPPQVPQLSTAPAVSDATMQQLQNAADRARSTRQGLEDQINNFQSYALPGAPQRSPIENKLDQALQQKMMKLISGGNSAADRFNSGWDMGQKLAGGILVPLMGAMSKGGTAIGLAQAAQQMSEQSAQETRAHQQQKQANNEALLQLSRAYEDMSPNSAKSMLENARAQLATVKQNQEDQRSLATQHLSAQNSEREALTALGEAQAKNHASGNTAAKDQFGMDTKSAEIQNSLGAQAFNQQDKINENTRADQNLGIRQDENARGAQSQDLAGQKFVYEQKQAVKNGNMKNSEQELSGAKDLGSIIGSIQGSVGRTNILGQPKDPTLLDRIMQNPAQMASIDAKIKQAGSLAPDGMTAKSLIQSMVDYRNAQNAPKSSGPGPMDVLNAVGGAIGSGFSSLSGGGSKDVLPTSPAAAAQPLSIDSAAAFLKRKKGQ